MLLAHATHKKKKSNDGLSMKHLLNLLAAVSLLIWGTHLVRTGILSVFGANLRQLIAHSVSSRFTAVLSGIGVTAVVQSSTATALIVSSFVGQGLVSLPAALAVMLGADVGTSVMAVVFSMDLSWLSPLLIFVGVVLFTARKGTAVGRVGRVLIGLGLMLLALRLITESTTVLTQSPTVRTLLGALTSDLLLEIFTGALLAIVAYSSLATVLLTAALAGSGGIPPDVALGLVLGANLGSGVLAVLTTLKANVQTRQVPLGNLFFKIIGVLIMTPLTGLWLEHVRPYVPEIAALVVLFHLAFNIVVGIVCIGLTGTVARTVQRLLPQEKAQAAAGARPQHLDPSALATPSLAISCAAREALHQADVVEAMLLGLHKVIRTDDIKLAEELRKLDDEVDGLYSAIKYYDIIERVLIDIEDKKIKKGRRFSEAGMEEINELHARLIDNLRLAMSVFLNGSVRDAQKLLEEKARFRDLEHAYSATHLARLSDNTVQSIETSSLHIDLISELKRINSLLCSVAYPILESAGALAPSRLRTLNDQA